MRGLDLVEALRNAPLRVADLARAPGLSRTTTRRLAAALVERGYVAQRERGPLSLGPTLLQLGFTAHRRIDIVRVARTRMEALSADTGLCVFLGRREGEDSLHLDRAAGRQRLKVSARRPATGGADRHRQGAVVRRDDATLARLYRAAANIPVTDALSAAWVADMHAHAGRGHVVHDSVGNDGIRSIAAPIRDMAGDIVAAIDIATAAQYPTDDKVAAIGPEVAATALAISRHMGFAPAP